MPINLQRVTNVCSKTEESLENPFLKARSHLDLVKYLLSHWYWSTTPLTVHWNITVILSYGAVKPISPSNNPQLWVKSIQVRSVKKAIWVIFMKCMFRRFILTSILSIYKVKKICCWEMNNWKWLHASWALPDQINHNNFGIFEAALIKMHWSLEDDSGRRGWLVSSSDK